MSLYIESDWVESDETVSVRNKYDGSVIEEVSVATPADVARAVEAANEARTTMAGLPAHRRAEILRETSRLIADRRESFAETMAAEAGEPIRTAQGEVDRAVGTFHIAAGEAERLNGGEIPLDGRSLPAVAGRPQSNQSPRSSLVSRRFSISNSIPRLSVSPTTQPCS